MFWITTAPGIAGALPAKKAHTLLGQDTDIIVFDAHSGFDVNAFAAVSGTLRGGGTLYLLTPPLDEWADFPDPDYRRFIPYPYQPHEVRGRFLGRFVGMLKTGCHCRSFSPIVGLKSDLQVVAVETILQADAPVVLTAAHAAQRRDLLQQAADALSRAAEPSAR